MTPAITFSSSVVDTRKKIQKSLKLSLVSTIPTKKEKQFETSASGELG
jgi:hypothetical protein